jgi:hypothetical protein
MIRRVTSVFAAVLALFALPATFSPQGAPLASALPMAPMASVLPMAPMASAVFYGCSITVPTTVWVSGPHVQLPASLGSDCAAHYATYASWNVRHASYGTSDIFIFDQRRQATNTVYDWEPFGTYYVEPRNSWSNFFELSQNSRSYVVKSGSGISVSSARVGRYVTLNVAASYYSPQSRGFRPWPGARVQLQSQACPTCVWQNLQAATTDSQGSVTMRTYAVHIHIFRAIAAGNPTTWGRTSQGVRR